MQKEEIQDLVHKYLNDQATAEELAKLSIWYDTTNLDKVEWLANVNNEEELLKAQMFQQITKATNIDTLSLVRRRSWIGIGTKIAAAIALITVGIYFYSTSRPDSTPYLPIVAQNDIAPGKNTATLELGNGKVIPLNETHTGVVIDAKKLTYYDGSAVSGTGNNGIREQSLSSVVTPRGGHYQVTLPDGSQVWLNASSRVTFSLDFTDRVKRQRRIELIGEAYFEVVKDAKHPFVVVSRGQEVRVLGTHFNVSSYPDDASIKTTLLEGAVKVTNLMSNKSEQIVPGQQAIIKDRDMKITAANLAEATAWKDGYFRFHELDFETLMKKISRWYNVDFTYEGGLDNYKGLVFGGTVSSSKNISEILNIIERTGQVHFEIRGREIKVRK